MTGHRSRLNVLLAKEWLRFRKQPMAQLLLGLLTAVSILIATGGPQLRGSGESKLPTCWIVYEEDNPWIDYLKEHVPESPPIRIVSASNLRRRGSAFVYPGGDGAMEISTHDRQHPHITIRYPGIQPNILWPHTQWFWTTTVAFIGKTPAFDQTLVPMARTNRGSAADVLRQTSLSDLLTIEMVGGLLMFVVQFFCCVHLLISFTSQERERGTLLALALTPASLWEILLSKCLFHGGLALAMCGLVAGILQPAALFEPLLWTTLVASTAGFLAVGTLIASLARNQANAALLTLCYMLGMALVFHLSRGYAAFSILRELMFEHRSLLMVSASLKVGSHAAAWRGFPALIVVVAGWIAVATWVFQKRGWR